MSAAATANATSAARTAFSTMIGSEGSQGAPTLRRQDLLTSRETRLLSGVSGKHCGDADLAPAALMVPPLAHAFLALADDERPSSQRTLPRVVVAAIAAWVLAFG